MQKADQYVSPFEEIFHKMAIRAEYGKDQTARRQLERLAFALVLLNPRDFWTYLYDWCHDASQLLAHAQLYEGAL